MAASSLSWWYSGVLFKEKFAKELGIALKILYQKFPPPLHKIVMTKSGGRSSRRQFTVFVGDEILGVLYNERWGYDGTGADYVKAQLADVDSKIKDMKEKGTYVGNSVPDGAKASPASKPDAGHPYY